MNDITVQMKAMQMSACTAMNHPKKGKILLDKNKKIAMHSPKALNIAA